MTESDRHWDHISTNSLTTATAEPAWWSSFWGSAHLAARSAVNGGDKVYHPLAG